MNTDAARSVANASLDTNPCTAKLLPSDVTRPDTSEFIEINATSTALIAVAAGVVDDRGTDRAASPSTTPPSSHCTRTVAPLAASSTPLRTLLLVTGTRNVNAYARRAVATVGDPDGRLLAATTTESPTTMRIRFPSNGLPNPRTTAAVAYNSAVPRCVAFTTLPPTTYSVYPSIAAASATVKACTSSASIEEGCVASLLCATIRDPSAITVAFTSADDPPPAASIVTPPTSTSHRRSTAHAFAPTCNRTRTRHCPRAVQPSMIVRLPAGTTIGTSAVPLPLFSDAFRYVSHVVWRTTAGRGDAATASKPSDAGKLAGHPGIAAARSAGQSVDGESVRDSIAVRFVGILRVACGRGAVTDVTERVCDHLFVDESVVDKLPELTGVCVAFIDRVADRDVDHAGHAGPGKQRCSCDRTAAASVSVAASSPLVVVTFAAQGAFSSTVAHPMHADNGRLHNTTLLGYPDVTPPHRSNRTADPVAVPPDALVMPSTVAATSPPLLRSVRFDAITVAVTFVTVAVAVSATIPTTDTAVAALHVKVTFDPVTASPESDTVTFADVTLATPTAAALIGMSVVISTLLFVIATVQRDSATIVDDAAATPTADTPQP